MRTLKLFMKRPTTWMGIATALMFQFIFSVVWMTGYEGVTDRTGQLRVGIVNEDQGLDKAVASKLQSSLPVQTVLLSDREEAMEQLDERELQMVIRIPSTFSADAAAADRQASLDFWINESNPSLIKSIMTSVSGQVTAEVNKAAVGEGVRQILAKVQPAEQAAAASAALAERVVGHVQPVNPVSGMNNQMIPMMMVLASFVGSMIMSMNLEQSSAALAAQTGRWQRLAARCVLNVAAAVGVSLVGASLIMALGGQAERGFLALWGLMFVMLLSFLFLTQMFLLLFGIGGMVFNILLLSVQLVSSGAMVPRELLNDFYANLGNVLPATYAVESGMDVLFGGPGAGRAVGMLLLIALSCAAVGAGTVALKPGRQPVREAAQAS
ncbi:YhgE/Pip domain-containing protein [Cohnella laeviribosi]|uniref:YhgE/Pip domain-containing protein n=1 Tax=Cohnella laeviribosi TaxID=380174 RepID=UPI000369F705|nr:ABC transporter permease [Cohnella laeviribosi]